MAKHTTNNVIQEVAALIGITLGLIPLGSLIFGNGLMGPLRWMFGEHDGGVGYVYPIVVLAIVAAVLMWTDRRERLSR